MSTTSTADSKEQVRQATDIVDLIGQYLTLSREGRNYKALCPWHDDTQSKPARQSRTSELEVLGLRHRW